MPMNSLRFAVGAAALPPSDRELPAADCEL